MNKQRAILVLVVLLIVTGLALLLSSSPSEDAAVTETTSEPTTEPTPSASPTFDPYAKERGEIRTRTEELGAKYFTYTRPDSTEYLEPLRPYFASDLYEKVKADNQKFGRVSSEPLDVKSTVKTVAVDDANEREGVGRVRLETVEPSQTYEQEYEFQWLKVEGEWRATHIELLSSSRKVEDSDG